MLLENAALTRASNLDEAPKSTYSSLPNATERREHVRNGDNSRIRTSCRPPDGTYVDQPLPNSAAGSAHIKTSTTRSIIASTAIEEGDRQPRGRAEGFKTGNEATFR